MSWLNLNQSLNSLKGQITNFATEVLSEGVSADSSDNPPDAESRVQELEKKCHNQELEIAALKKLTDELQATVQSERLSKKNGVREEESSWYWDPPTHPVTSEDDIEKKYKIQIRILQDEISNLKERETISLASDVEEQLHRLQEENRNLTSNLEDLDNQHQLAMDRLLTLKKELQKSFELLKGEHEELKAANEEYLTENQRLLAKIGERDKEIESLKTAKTDYDTLHHKYLNLEKVHSLLKEHAEKFQEDNQELQEEVFKLQEEVTRLEHEMEIVTKHSELSNTVPREKYEELLSELREIRQRKNSNPVHLDDSNIDDNAKGVIETLKRDIGHLKHQLSQRDVNNSDNDYRVVKSEKVMQLYNKYINFELPVDYIGEMSSSNDNIVLFKLESAFKTLNSFKKEIDVLEHKISEKDLNISHLQTQIDDLNAENEFCTTDIQQIEKELSEMKKNNDFLISELTALKNTSKLQPIIETHEDNLAKLETELADCNKVNKTYESEIKRIEKELTEVKTEKLLLVESMSDLKLKYKTMLNELEMCKTKTTAVEELENSTRLEQNDKLKKALDELDDLKKRLNITNSKNEQLSIDNHIIENDKVLLTKELDDLKHILEEKEYAHRELEAMKEALDQKLQDLEIRLDDVIRNEKELENEKVILNLKIAELENQVAHNNNTCSSDLIEKLKLEKNELAMKLNQTLQENSTLVESIEKHEADISNLRRAEELLLAENSTFRLELDKQKNRKDENETVNKLKENLEDMKAKLIQQDILQNEIVTLKNDIQKLTQEKQQLEAELTTTDNKIGNLEQEFEKLIGDLNEKDAIIDEYNSTDAQNRKKLSELNQNVSDLTSTIQIKNQEIERINVSLNETKQKLNDLNQKSETTLLQMGNILIEKEELGKKNEMLEEMLASKNVEITAIVNHLDQLENTVKEYETSINNKDTEIKELRQSIEKLTDQIKNVDNSTHSNDEYVKLLHEKETMEKEVAGLKNSVALKEKQFQELVQKSEQFERTCTECKTILDTATKEKTELINLINLKHNESVQYHNEIQRLNQVLLEQSNEYKRLISEKDILLQSNNDNCTTCDNLRRTLIEKDEIIMSLNHNNTEFDRIRSELANASETIRNLTEKCASLDSSLTAQLDLVKKLTAENAQLSEKEQNSTRELERLRHHLVELEENYTQELMTSEHKLTECQTRLHQIEERAKQTSTVYTSNSIRANQEVETLRNQIKLLEKQREEVQTRLSEAEDGRNRSEAALTNLQVVLEQFQMDKDRDIAAATEKIRNQVDDMKRQNSGLQDEITRLNAKLEESLAGLQAATRLGDQVETKSAQINDLKEQVRALQSSVSAAEERYHNAISNQQDRVDKNLVKNLVLNYVLTAAQSASNKTQVLRVLSTVLDFNQQECEKLGLVRPSGAPDSLAAEFVKFLQQESKPRAALPNMMGLAQTGGRSSTPQSRRNSTLGPQPTPEPGHKRNPSTGSNNLLFQNIDNVETSSQISIESERVDRVLETGVNQTRNTEGAILKYVLKDM